MDTSRSLGSTCRGWPKTEKCETNSPSGHASRRGTSRQSLRPLHSGYPVPTSRAATIG